MVLCAPLCFIFYKYEKFDNNKIKSAFVGFYSHENIIDAKEHLIKDSEDISGSHGRSGSGPLPLRAWGKLTLDKMDPQGGLTLDIK